MQDCSFDGFGKGLGATQISFYDIAVGPLLAPTLFETPDNEAHAPHSQFLPSHGRCLSQLSMNAQFSGAALLILAKQPKSICVV